MPKDIKINIKLSIDGLIIKVKYYIAILMY